MNLGSFTNTYGGIMVYFDIINTVDESGISYMYDVSASTTQTDGEIKVQAIVDNDEGYIPFGSITPSEITGELKIPDTITKIPSCAFYGCSDITNVSIPEGVTSIGDYAFSVCTSLTEITIPSSVTSIGVYAFDVASGEMFPNLDLTIEMSENEVWQVSRYSDFSTIYAELTYSDLQDTANNVNLFNSTYRHYYWRKVVSTSV